MKKLLSLKTLLICISFTVFLLLVKDNMNVLWSALGWITGIITPFAIGFLFAYILNYPYKFFYTKVFGRMGRKRKFLANFRKPLALIITYAIVVAIFVIIISIVVPQIAASLFSLINSLPQYGGVLSDMTKTVVHWINHTFSMEIDASEVINNFFKFITNLISAGNITSFLGNSTNAVFNAIMSMCNGVYNFLLGIVISVYFLAAKETLCRQIKKLAVAFIPIKYLPKIYEIVDITDTKCGRFLVGDIIDAAFLGVLTFITMSICQLPYAPLIAVLIGVTNIIPFFGPFIGAIPSAFILLLIDPIYMFIFIIIIVIIQQLDGNLFKPKIIGSQVGLSSFWVLFSVIVGGGMFGVLGLILGTPIYAVIYALVGKRVKNKIDSKGRIAQEALDFEVLNYTKIAAEQKKLREEKEMQHREKFMKFINRNKTNDEDESSDNTNE